MLNTYRRSETPTVDESSGPEGRENARKGPYPPLDGAGAGPQHRNSDSSPHSPLSGGPFRAENAAFTGLVAENRGRRDPHEEARRRRRTARTRAIGTYADSSAPEHPKNPLPCTQIGQETKKAPSRTPDPATKRVGGNGIRARPLSARNSPEGESSQTRRTACRPFGCGVRTFRRGRIPPRRRAQGSE